MNKTFFVYMQITYMYNELFPNTEAIYARSRYKAKVLCVLICYIHRLWKYEWPKV